MCPNEKKNSKSFRFTYVSKVITGFEYFQPRFAQQPVLIFFSSHQLTDEQKQQQVKLCHENLSKFQNSSWRLCDIITGDEMWIYHRHIRHK